MTLVELLALESIHSHGLPLRLMGPVGQEYCQFDLERLKSTPLLVKQQVLRIEGHKL